MARRSEEAARLGSSELHDHDLQSWYATALLDQGAALHLVAPLLGHRSSQITARYAHLRTDTLEAECDRLTLAIAPPKRITQSKPAPRRTARRKETVR